MSKFFISCLFLIAALAGACIFPERSKSINSDSINLYGNYMSLNENSNSIKDTIDFSKMEISDDSLDMKLYDLLNDPGEMSVALILKNIENLVQRGANPNAMLEVTYSVRKMGTYIPIIRHFYQDKYNEYTTVTSPMHAAVSFGNTVIVEKLISFGGNTNLVNKDNVYLIDIALNQDNIKMVDCLILHGCKVSNANLSMSQNTNLIVSLVKAGANPKTIDINYALEDKDQLTKLLALKPPLNELKLDMEILINDEQLLDLLLQNGMSVKVKGKFPDECPILFSAIKYGNMQTFIKLHKKGASLNERCLYGFGETPLQTAIYYQKIEMIDYMLKNNISANEKDWTGKSALINACNTDNDQIINMLIDKGAELEYTGYFGNTPLLYACQYQHYISAETLIKRKANINFRSKAGDTALSLAISANDYAMIKLLVENGANYNIKANSKNLVQFAQDENASPAIVQYLNNLIKK